MSAPTRRDVLFNAIGFAVFAGGALAANILIARFYGPEATGLFNQVLALYMVASQFAAFGVHLAALRAASLVDPRETAPLLASALLAVAGPAVLTAAAGYAFSFAIPRLFTTAGLDAAWRMALPGLIAFAVNKVLINIANGLGRYRLFAIAQAMRSLLFLALVGLWIVLGLPGTTVALALSLAEIALVTGLGAFFILRDGLSVPADWRERARWLMRFGASAMPSVAFSDLNGRIDVLVLGLFAAPETIGVYTIASWLAQGAVQLAVAVRPLVNARLASLTSAGAHAELKAMVRRIGLLTAAALVALMGALCLAYPFIATWLLGDPRYAGALVPLLILSAGVVIAAPTLPFDLLLAQSGRPGAHSRFKAAVMLTNLVLALLLVPRLGAVGAAIAYAASFATYALWLRIAVRRHIGPVM